MSGSRENPFRKLWSAARTAPATTDSGRSAPASTHASSSTDTAGRHYLRTIHLDQETGVARVEVKTSASKPSMVVYVTRNETSLLRYPILDRLARENAMLFISIATTLHRCGWINQDVLVEAVAHALVNRKQFVVYRFAHQGEAGLMVMDDSDNEPEVIDMTIDDDE